MDQTHHLPIVVFILLIVAALPRFYELDSLSFYGDEETTAFPALSMAEGTGAKMPSGMPYHRALPFTWLNAISAHLFGSHREVSYRIPAAILGTLTVPLLFLLSRPLIGGSAAFIAALLLAASEWHIITSREARMYVPFLFFYVWTAFMILQWARSNEWRYLLASSLLFCVTVSVHTLGILAVLFALIPLAIPGYSKVSPIRLVIFAAAAAIAAHMYSEYFVMDTYTEWKSAQENLLSTPTPDRLDSAKYSFMIPDNLAFVKIALAVLGFVLGLWAARLCHVIDRTPGSRLREISQFALAGLGGASACLGQIYGASIATLLFLLIHSCRLPGVVRKSWLPISFISVIALGWLAALTWEHGFIDGLKLSVAFPFPYSAFIAEMFPGIFLLFIGTCFFVVIQSCNTNNQTLCLAILAVILPLTAVGLVSRWGGIRYLIETYPFLILVSSVGLLNFTKIVFASNTQKNGKLAFIVSVFIVLSGVLGGHGIPQALYASTIEHGERTHVHTLGYSIYPDHRNPGLYVRKHRKPGDIVIAEDALQQRWYVGTVDYWLRDHISSRKFLYQTADGSLRDIYVNSIALTPELLTKINNDNKKRIWIITSAETIAKRDYYLTPEQQGWLEWIENTNTPMFTGLDGVTKVYCLNCDQPAIESNSTDLGNI